MQITCLAHGLHGVTEEIRIHFTEINNLISNIKKVFLNLHTLYTNLLIYFNAVMRIQKTDLNLYSSPHEIKFLNFLNLPALGLNYEQHYNKRVEVKTFLIIIFLIFR